MNDDDVDEHSDKRLQIVQEFSSILSILILRITL